MRYSVSINSSNRVSLLDWMKLSSNVTLHGWGSTPYVSRLWALWSMFNSAKAAHWPLKERRRGGGRGEKVWTSTCWCCVQNVSVCLVMRTVTVQWWICVDSIDLHYIGSPWVIYLCFYSLLCSHTIATSESHVCLIVVYHVSLITVVTFGSVDSVFFAGNRVAACSSGGVEVFTLSFTSAVK